MVAWARTGEITVVLPGEGAPADRKHYPTNGTAAGRCRPGSFGGARRRWCGDPARRSADCRGAHPGRVGATREPISYESRSPSTVLTVTSAWTSETCRRGEFPQSPQTAISTSVCPATARLPCRPAAAPRWKHRGQSAAGQRPRECAGRGFGADGRRRRHDRRCWSGPSLGPLS